MLDVGRRITPDSPGGTGEPIHIAEETQSSRAAAAQCCGQLRIACHHLFRLLSCET